MQKDLWPRSMRLKKQLQTPIDDVSMNMKYTQTRDRCRKRLIASCHSTRRFPRLRTWWNTLKSRIIFTGYELTWGTSLSSVGMHGQCFHVKTFSRRGGKGHASTGQETSVWLGLVQVKNRWRNSEHGRVTFEIFQRVRTRWLQGNFCEPRFNGTWRLWWPPGSSF